MNSKKVSRFERFRANQTKDDMESIQKIKNRLILLANDMLKSKQINKSLYGRMEKLTYSRTRKATLLTNIDALQAIQDKFKTNEAQTRQTKGITQKYSIKELKQIKNEVKADEDVSYNVYIKYKAYVSESDASEEKKNVELIVIDGKEYKTRSYINNETILVKGKKNIRSELKLFIKSIMQQPYILKLEIKNVTINKQIIHQNQYRWLGAENSTKKSGYIRYFKAWDMGFKYHKYNLDLNDETPFECVPNALYKMYGNRKNNKGYIASIANGGLDYIKNKLDSYEEQILYENKASDLDFGLVELIPYTKQNKKGYSPAQILKFCNEHKLRCFGYDWKLQQFITNKNMNISFNHDGLRAFVFYMNDDHIYLINDKELRHALLHSNDKNDIISMFAKQRDMTKKGEREANVAFELWDLVNDVPLFERVDLPYINAVRRRASGCPENVS